MTITLQFQKKLFRIMQISMCQAFMALIFASMAYANNGKAQEILESKITLRLEDVTIEQALKQLENSANVRFMYSPEIFEVDKKTSFSFKKIRLDKILSKMLDPLHVKYKLDGRDIILKRSQKSKSSNEDLIEEETNVIEKKADVTKTGKGVVAIPVTGIIKDDKGVAVPGVTVSIKGTTNGVITDADGKFSIEVFDESAVLVVSYLGYKTQEIILGNRTNLDVSLEEDVKVLSEVVATGYSQMKRTDLSSAQVSVSAKQIEQTVNTTMEQALQGRAAGVQVTQNSGQPGGGISVNIRGTSTVGNSTQPLYIIDGVQITGSVGGPDNSSFSSTNPLSFINPSDIESLEILQGPSATAIYGSRATNGVVLVTTKRGKAGNMKVDYSFTYTLQDTPKFLKTMDLQQYAIYRNALAVNGGNESSTEFSNPAVLGEGTNWQREIFQRAPLMKHQISLSGGNDKTTYYLSGEYMKQDGVVVGSNFNRYGLRLNVDNKTFKWLTINQSLGLAQTRELVNSSADGAINTALSQAPNVAAKNPDGSYGGPTVVNSYLVTNPLAIANLNDRTRVSNNIYGNMGAEVKIIKGLTFRTNFSGGTTFGTTYEWAPSYKVGTYENPITSSTRGSNYNNNWVLNELLSYNRKFAEKHDLTVMASHEAIYNEYENISATRTGYSSKLIRELNAGGTANPPTSDRGTFAMESYFARLNYVFDDKYIVQASLRYDGSSTFGTNNKWGVFPAVSAAWRVSQESFLKDIKQISDLKIRAEYGMTGNPGWGTSYFSALNPAPSPLGIGYRPNNFANPNLKWESTATFNLGLNLSLFNNRIEFIGDYYIKNTDNLLNQLPLAGVYGTQGGGGIQPPVVNLGKLKNEGVALTLNAVVIEKPFTWRTNVNFSLNRNKITELYSSNTNYDKSAWFISGLIERSTVGLPVNQMIGYEYAGIIQNYAQLMDSATAVPEANRYTRDPQHTYVGDFLWKDQNGDSIINDKDVKVIGDPNPKFTFGFTNTFGYKGFELMVLCTGSYGNDIYNYTKQVNENPNNGNAFGGRLVQTADYAKIATDGEGNPYVLNSGTNIPRLAPGDNNGSYTRPSTRWVEDGSYLRIKNIQLSYNIPTPLLSKLAIVRSLRVAVGCQNAFTFTSYTGYDPEVGAMIGQSNSANTFIGVDYGRYPLTRMYTFSVNVGF